MSSEIGELTSGDFERAISRQQRARLVTGNYIDQIEAQAAEFSIRFPPAPVSRAFRQT